MAFPIHAADGRPNVLMIAVDDLRAAIDGRDQPMAITPNLDALAKTGVRFDHAYCQIPLCNPSRASILTGLRPDQTRVYDLDRHFRDQVPEVVTLPQMFRHHGWFAARVGKLFHYDVPNGIGTDGLDDPPSWDRVINPKGRDVSDAALITNAEPHRPISAALSWLAAEGTDEEQTDGMIATEAIRLMRERDKSLPFFIGVGFFRPHTPYVAPKKWFDLYPIKEMSIPFAPADDRADIPLSAFAHNNAEPHYGLPLETLRQAKQAYYASVSFVDAQIGRVLDELEALGLAEQTLVVLWSDHGYHLGEHGGIWQKRTLFEEASLTPMMIRAPGAAGNGRSCQRVVELVDLYPTLADLAGLPLPPGQKLTGRSLRPLLEKPDAPWEGRAVTQILRPSGVMGRSVRTEHWRYTEWNGGEKGRELYDIQTDPFEFVNKAGGTEVKILDTIEKMKVHFEQRAEPLPPQSPVNPKRL